MSSLLCGTSGNTQNRYASTSDEDCIPFTDNDPPTGFVSVSYKSYYLEHANVVEKCAKIFHLQIKLTAFNMHPILSYGRTDTETIQMRITSFDGLGHTE